MAGNKEKLVIVGDGETAEIAYEYFTGDSNYEVVAFSAEKNFMKNRTLFGLPVIPFEEIERFFDPKDYKAFVAISFTQLNRLRTRLFNITKAKGYTLCSYISPKAFTGKNVEIGENCFILENVTIQRSVKIGNNVTIWSGSFIGHRTVIGDNCFSSSSRCHFKFLRSWRELFFWSKQLHHKRQKNLERLHHWCWSSSY